MRKRLRELINRSDYPKQNIEQDIDKLTNNCICEIYPSMACQLKCSTCDRGHEKSELSDFSDVKNMYDNVAADVTVSRFAISGGEPLLYPRINELLEFVHGLSKAKITFFTNGLAFKNLDERNYDKVDLHISTYPYTVARQINDEHYRKVYVYFMVRNLELHSIFYKYHQDLSDYGKTKNEGYSPLMCLQPTLLCGTKRVYPCCRAHLFEQKNHTQYHFDVSEEDLYYRLVEMVLITDLCHGCNRMYTDAGWVSLYTDTAIQMQKEDFDAIRQQYS